MNKLRNERSAVQTHSTPNISMQQSRAHNPFITVLYQRVRMSEIRDETFLVWFGVTQRMREENINFKGKVRRTRKY